MAMRTIEGEVLAALLVLLLLFAAGPGHVLAQPSPASDEAAYTGLIVVARGAQRSISPKLLTPAGVVIYGSWKPGEVNVDYAIKVGVVGYPASVAQSRRGGANPLVVEALGVTGPARTHVVVSEPDAARIRAANVKGRFLERFLVDIVIQH
jgi:hypothetical protein